jgi:hypothetical protein
MEKEKPGKSRSRRASGVAARKSVKVDIEKVSEQVLSKLQALNLEHGLQADIQWCIGSYRHDKNPIGLYQMLERALPVLKHQREKNSRSVAVKLIADIEKVLKER